MNKVILLLGMTLLIAGVAIARSPVHIPEVGHWSLGDGDTWVVDVPAQTIYPYATVGAIICLIGFNHRKELIVVPEIKKRHVFPR